MNLYVYVHNGRHDALSYEFHFDLRQSCTIGQCDTLRRWVAVESDILWSTFCCLLTILLLSRPKCKYLRLFARRERERMRDTICLFWFCVCFCVEYDSLSHSVYIWLVSFIVTSDVEVNCIKLYFIGENCELKIWKNQLGLADVDPIRFDSMFELTFNIWKSFLSIRVNKLLEQVLSISIYRMAFWSMIASNL